MKNKKCVNVLMRECASADASATNAFTQSHNNAITRIRGDKNRGSRFETLCFFCNLCD